MINAIFYTVKAIMDKTSKLCYNGIYLNEKRISVNMFYYYKICFWEENIWIFSSLRTVLSL